MHGKFGLTLCGIVLSAVTAGISAQVLADPGRALTTRTFPTGNVIFSIPTAPV